MIITAAILIAVFAGISLLSRTLEHKRRMLVYSLRQQWTADAIIANADAQLGWALRPSWQAVLDGIAYHTNEHGFRDYTREITRENSELRILFFGGTAGFGWGNRLDDITSSVLEAQLNMATPGYAEVLNASVPGYDLARNVRSLTERLYIFAPDIIIIAISAADLADPPSAGADAQCPPAGAPPVAAALAAQQCKLLAQADTAAAMNALADEANKRGYTVLWAVLPPLDDPWDSRCRDTLAAINEQAKQLGFYVADLPAAFERANISPRKLHSTLPWELSAQGHRQVADALWNALVVNKLLLRPLQVMESRGVEGL